MPNIDVRPSADGKNVALKVTHDGQGISINLDPKTIGLLVTAMLSTTIECARNTKTFARLVSRETDPKKLHYVPVSEVAVADSDKPDIVTLVFAIGATQLSLGVHREALERLGTALLTASADLSRPQ